MHGVYLVVTCIKQAFVLPQIYCPHLLYCRVLCTLHYQGSVHSNIDAQHSMSSSIEISNQHVPTQWVA